MLNNFLFDWQNILFIVRPCYLTVITTNAVFFVNWFELYQSATLLVQFISQNVFIQENLIKEKLGPKLDFSELVLFLSEELPYVPLDFEVTRTIDTLVDSRAFVHAITQIESDRIKQHAPANTIKKDDPPSFQIQITNGQLKND